jgi:HAD superfamily phosphoserine phosphatase-like hydrolase
MADKIRMLLFDLDGTLIQYPSSKFQSTWDAVGVAAGVEKEFEENLEKFYQHSHLWNQWAKEDAELLKDKDFNEVKRKVLELIVYSPGVEELFDTLSDKYQKGILSNGLGFVANELCQNFGLGFYMADELSVKEGKFTGEVVAGMPNRDKTKGLEMICDKYQVEPQQICYVGDHENDLVVFKEVGKAVAFNPKTEEVREKAHYVISDFKELLKIIE